MTIRNFKNATFLLFLTGCIATTSIQESFCMSAQPIAQAEKPVFGQLSQRLIFGILALQLCYITGNDEVKKTLEEQCHPKNLIKNVVWQYLVTAFSTLAHELGHASAANLLNNDKFNAHLGANSFTGTSTLFNVGQSISIDGIDPLAGHSFYALPKQPDGSLAIPALGVILGAGAISAIASNVLLNSTLNNFFPNEQAFQRPWQENPIIINQLWNLLIPTGNNDAAQLYTQCFGLPKEAIAKITKITTYFAMITELYYLQATSAHPDQYGSHSKVLLAFANWHLNGFARFNL